MIKFFFFLFLALGSIFAQTPITVSGEKLEGYEVDGEKMRRVIGDVVITQDNIVIKCDSAIHFIKQNNAELMGNVVITQDTLTIKTPKGFYFGKEKRAYSNSGVELDDKKVYLIAGEGEYFFDSAKAIFINNVVLHDKSDTLSSDFLTYYRYSGIATATGNVNIRDSVNVVMADSLIHYRFDRITYAFNNVQINSFEENLVITGGYLEDYRDSGFSKILIDPFLIQVDTSGGKQDTLYIRSAIMETFREPVPKFVAIDSVVILSSEFSSVNTYTIFERDSGIVYISKLREDDNQPIIWYEDTQLTGDSIKIVTTETGIEALFVRNNSLIASRNINYPVRIDQMSGRDIDLTFDDGALYSTDVSGGVLSYYYSYEDGIPDGLLKSSGARAVIIFADGRADEVRLYGDPESEYYPENLVRGSERKYLLPSFREFFQKPGFEENFKSFIDKIRPVSKYYGR